MKKILYTLTLPVVNIFAYHLYFFLILTFFSFFFFFNDTATTEIYTFPTRRSSDLSSPSRSRRVSSRLPAQHPSGRERSCRDEARRASSRERNSPWRARR